MKSIVLDSNDWFRFARYRSQRNDWVDEVKDDLYRTLTDYKQLVTIFDFHSKKYDGKLENAILDAVFNGLLEMILKQNNDLLNSICFSCKNV